MADHKKTAVLTPEPNLPASPAPVAEVPLPVPAQMPEAPAPVPSLTMSEDDAYVFQRVAGSPATLDEVRAHVTPITERNRLSLPDELERYSYDCTIGRGCPHHSWGFDEREKQWQYSNKGEFIFRWVWKDKRSIDRYLNVWGWFIVQRRYFSDISKHLFSANGAIEVGDSILFFLPAKQALAIRNAPGKRSSELVNSRITRTQKGVMMTGRAEDARYYMPEASGSEEESEDKAPGLQEGRDF